VNCFVASLLTDRPVPASLKDCGGPGEFHHLIRKNRIKQELSPSLAEKALGDLRNMVPVCRKHHEHVENRRIVIWREDLPAAVHEFAAEYGLEGWLDRYYPPAPTSEAA
jgi:hypothetical protein